VLSNEDGVLWVFVPEHSPATRYRALQVVGDETGEDWLAFGARRVWMRDHDLEPCGYKRLQALPPDERELAEERYDTDEYACWCYEGEGGGYSVCPRDADGAHPAWQIEAR
jgi:hypothetical protein